jgi:hypothetical protein
MTSPLRTRKATDALEATRFLRLEDQLALTFEDRDVLNDAERVFQKIIDGRAG